MAFNELFNLCASSFGGFKPSEAEDKSRPYLLNGQWLTRQEAMEAVRCLPQTFISSTSGFRISAWAKTLFPFRFNESVGYNLNKMCYNGASYLLKSVAFDGTIKAEDVVMMFGYNRGLEEVLGVIDLSPITTAAKAEDMLYTCTSLREIRLKGLKVDFRFQSEHISYESLEYLTTNAANASAITIKVPGAVFSALSGDASYPFNGGSRDQWLKLAGDAAARQIAFASA